MERPRIVGSRILGRSPLLPSTFPNPGPSDPEFTVNGSPLLARNTPEIRHPPATRRRSLDVDPRRVEVGVRGVLNPAEFKVARVGAPVGNGGRGLRDAGYMHDPVREPHHKELVGAAADVTELDVPGAAR